MHTHYSLYPDLCTLTFVPQHLLVVEQMQATNTGVNERGEYFLQGSKLEPSEVLHLLTQKEKKIFPMPSTMTKFDL